VPAVLRGVALTFHKSKEVSYLFGRAAKNHPLSQIQSVFLSSKTKSATAMADKENGVSEGGKNEQVNIFNVSMVVVSF
jgi:hypothetical protein